MLGDMQVCTLHRVVSSIQNMLNILHLQQSHARTPQLRTWGRRVSACQTVPSYILLHLLEIRFYISRILVREFFCSPQNIVWQTSCKVAKNSTFSCNKHAKNCTAVSWRNISCCERKHICTEKRFIIISCQFSWPTKLNILWQARVSFFIMHLVSFCYTWLYTL
jgi:hypothetical protein